MPGRPMTVAPGPTVFANEAQESNTDAHNFSNRDFYGGGTYENNPLQGPSNASVGPWGGGYSNSPVAGPTNPSVGNWGGNYSNSPIPGPTNPSVGNWGGNYSNSPTPGPVNPSVGDWGGVYDNGVSSRSGGWGPPPSNPVLPQSGVGRPSFAPPTGPIGAPQSSGGFRSQSDGGSSFADCFPPVSRGPPAPPDEPGFPANRTMFADSAPYQSFPWNASGSSGANFPPAGTSPAQSAPPTRSLTYGSAPAQGHRSGPTSSSGGLAAGIDQLSMEDLVEMRDERAYAVQDLRQEIEELKQAPDLFERRLQRLEGAFGAVQPGDAVLVKAPMLRNIHRCLKEKKASEIQDAAEHHKDMYQHEEWYDPTQAYADTNTLVLGRGYMSLDLHNELMRDFKERHVKHPHPVIDEVRYSGHLTKAADQIHPSHVGPHGQSERKAAYKPSDWHGEFWLDKKEGDRGDGNVVAVSAAEQAFIEKATSSAAAAKHEEDTVPTDHLGMKKREMPDNNFEHDEWTLPRWMY